MLPSTKCKTYILTCSTCHEHFISTKCKTTTPTTNSTGTSAFHHHTHAKTKDLSHLQLGHLRARIQGLNTTCWHCDPEARLDFTSISRSGLTASQFSSMKNSRYVGRMTQQQQQRSAGIRSRIKAIARRGGPVTMTTTAWTKPCIGRMVRRWTGWVTGRFTASRRRGERLPDEKSPRPATAQTIDIWKLPRMFD